MAEQKTGPQGGKMIMELAPGTDYVYRDMFNVFATPDDVVIEFGNVRRESGTAAMIADRIVLTPKNAAKLHKVLQQTLSGVKRKVKEQKNG